MIDCKSCVIGAACVGSCTFLRRSYRSGQALFHQGDAPQAANFLSAGQILLTETGEDGELIQQTLRSPGAMVDLQVLRGRRHRATAVASRAAEVCTLALSSLSGWLGAARSPARAMLELALAESGAAEVNAARSGAGAVARVAGFLLEQPAGVLSVSHQTAAGLLGLRPETFSRALARLREAGALADGLVVRDRAALARLADG